jgi:hypothetical protein
MKKIVRGTVVHSDVTVKIVWDAHRRWTNCISGLTTTVVTTMFKTVRASISSSVLSAMWETTTAHWLSQMGERNQRLG